MATATVLPTACTGSVVNLRRRKSFGDMPPVRQLIARGSWDKFNGLVVEVREHISDHTDEPMVGTSCDAVLFFSMSFVPYG